jgi:hypothetical protein
VTYRRWRCGSTAAATREDGVARSTTSVAVVYAVTVETGLNREDIGKLILTACFVTDLGTVLALGVGGFVTECEVRFTAVQEGVAPALILMPFRSESQAPNRRSPILTGRKV